jgi:hypothetical protein
MLFERSGIRGGVGDLWKSGKEIDHKIVVIFYFR